MTPRAAVRVGLPLFLLPRREAKTKRPEKFGKTRNGTFPARAPIGSKLLAQIHFREASDQLAAEANRSPDISRAIVIEIDIQRGIDLSSQEALVGRRDRHRGTVATGVPSAITLL
jgi:hypothetical protein